MHLLGGVTYMRRGGLGGSCSLEHGSSEVMEDPGGGAAPARSFLQGEVGSFLRSLGAPQALPQPAGEGVFTGRGLGGCGWDFP